MNTQQINVVCPKCGTTRNVNPSLAGLSTKCFKCWADILVPNSGICDPGIGAIPPNAPPPSKNIGGGAAQESDRPIGRVEKNNSSMKRWESWRLPASPSSDCDLEEKMSWVHDCDITLGLEHLGGILGSMKLADTRIFEMLFDVIRHTFEDDAKHMYSPHDERLKVIYRNISRAHPHESLCEYLFNFTAGAWPLVKGDNRFIAWIMDNLNRDNGWSQPTSLLLGGCLYFIIQATSNSPQNIIKKSDRSHKWWQLWK